ncbi:ATP phosphoribosyltransferase [Haloarcula argentinensis]|uniref:ATP phosphoribosyltransferase n=1 Tax=Haloarcula argentinensis TaxID=43776 RepID=A0A830FTJ1_HALAR|nr:ATP phosphoribosyltransferase [Haloarcula argentinensis]EMA20687.1 ATP phosphoribosyltransferase [Haloarcula argentinensis DSM 12282]MDS0255111.1 ATP phosphoribosyltransferase [Haloarcula argentinensis]GGM36460.1 ATP phosphoribosyltransferase [Haloarcula argentinensis]
MRIAVPNKGRLHEPSEELLERAGLHLVDGADRQLHADTVDPDVTVLYARAADIPEYVADGAADVGITGLDQVRESDADDLVELRDLDFGRCRLVLAAPEESDIETVYDFEDGRIATEFPKITRRYFDRVDVDVDVTEVSGATELTPHVDIADGIVDITSTGTTLRMNRLAVVDEVLESSVRLFAREDTAADEKVQQVDTALGSVLAAEDKRYLMMNAPEDALNDVEDVLPGMGGPTVMDIAGSDQLAVHAVVEERAVFETISSLKDVGASDILVTEIERLVE